MTPPQPQPEDRSGGHALRSLLISVKRTPDTADHAGLLSMFSNDAAVGEQVGVPVRGGPRPPVVSSGPDATLMTTAAAAHYLGLAGRDSTRIWLAQRGIRPVAREPGPSGQNLYPAESVMPLKGRGRRIRPAYDRWRDAGGVSIPLGARVEQVLVDRPHGALPSRLGTQAVVIRHGRRNRLVVRFDGENQTVSIRPDLLRVRPVSTGQIIDQLEQVRDLLPPEDDADGDGR
ncbi:MAG: hypothetical protein ACRDS0_28990 [Pseudonocardiaceae bacterium]